MASFDFIEAAVRGYDFVWRERKYLARVAFPVVFVKVACLFAVITFGAQDMYLRQGLILLPGVVIEALFMVGLIRYALYGENIFIWGRSFPAKKPPKPSIPQITDMSRVQCIQAGVALYVLAILFSLCFFGVVMDSAQVLDDPRNHSITDDQQSSSVLIGLVILGLMAASVWLFRLFWLYIPVAMGVRLTTFLKIIRGVESSIYMIGTWLICLLPPMVILGLVSQILASLFVQGSETYLIASAVFRAMFEVAVTSVQVAAMTYGFTEILFGAQTKDKK